MTRTLRLLSATALAALALPLTVTAAASAQDVEVSGNVALVSDYRFRGVSLSDETIAIQGGLDAGFASGLYIGTWASSIEPVGGSETELDLYGGYGFEAGGLAFDVGVLGYFYPGEEDVAYGELYGSATTALGVGEATFGVAYAPEQDNIGNDDNLYVYVSGGLPLGESPFSLSASLGYETGAFGDPDGDGDDKIDWSLGVSREALGIEWGLAYIGTSEDGDGVDGTAVLTIGRSL